MLYPTSTIFRVSAIMSLSCFVFSYNFTYQYCVNHTIIMKHLLLKSQTSDCLGQTLTWKQDF